MTYTEIISRRFKNDRAVDAGASRFYVVMRGTRKSIHPHTFFLTADAAARWARAAGYHVRGHYF